VSEDVPILTFSCPYVFRHPLRSNAIPESSVTLVLSLVRLLEDEVAASPILTSYCAGNSASRLIKMGYCRLNFMAVSLAVPYESSPLT